MVVDALASVGVDEHGVGAVVEHEEGEDGVEVSLDNVSLPHSEKVGTDGSEPGIVNLNVRESTLEQVATVKGRGNRFGRVLVEVEVHVKLLEVSLVGKLKTLLKKNVVRKGSGNSGQSGNGKQAAKNEKVVQIAD